VVYFTAQQPAQQYQPPPQQPYQPPPQQYQQPPAEPQQPRDDMAGKGVSFENFYLLFIFICFVAFFCL
jgi:hypothetical protein